MDLPFPASADDVVPTGGPLLPFRFGVFFFAGGVLPNPIDIRFQKVRGLESKVETTTLSEGGQNLYEHKLPIGVRHENLVLERGKVLASPLQLEVGTAISFFHFYPSNVMVTLFDEEKKPSAAWFFVRAFPVSWSTSDLDAEARDSVVIDTLELAYARVQPLEL